MDNSDGVQTDRQLRIRDLRMKKPRVDIEASVRAAGGNPEDLAWVPASEHYQLERELGTSIGTSDWISLWPAVSLPTNSTQFIGPAFHLRCTSALPPRQRECRSLYSSA